MIDLQIDQTSNLNRPVIRSKERFGNLSVMWQTAGGILIAAIVIVITHESWVYYQWRIETIRLRDKKAAELLQIQKDYPEIYGTTPFKLDMKKGLESVRKNTPIRNSWFASPPAVEAEN